MWSDSRIAIHWIGSEKKLPIFIGHSVKEITSFLDIIKYCMNNDNPGDLVTRDFSVHRLSQSDIC